MKQVRAPSSLAAWRYPRHAESMLWSCRWGGGRRIIRSGCCRSRRSQQQQQHRRRRRPQEQQQRRRRRPQQQSSSGGGGSSTSPQQPPQQQPAQQQAAGTATWRRFSEAHTESSVTFRLEMDRRNAAKFAEMSPRGRAAALRLEAVHSLRNMHGFDENDEFRHFSCPLEVIAIT